MTRITEIIISENTFYNKREKSKNKGFIDLFNNFFT